MAEWYGRFERFINRMDTHEWMIALLAIVVVGVFCLRGFGSRSDY